MLNVNFEARLSNDNIRAEEKESVGKLQPAKRTKIICIGE